MWHLKRLGPASRWGSSFQLDIYLLCSSPTLSLLWCTDVRSRRIFPTLLCPECNNPCFCFERKVNLMRFTTQTIPSNQFHWQTKWRSKQNERKLLKRLIMSVILIKRNRTAIRTISYGYKINSLVNHISTN